jgi:ketosteroid isomerase-like protein
MNNAKSIALLLFPAILLLGCQQRVDGSAEKPKVEQALHRFFNAIANYDYQGLRNSCTADYQLIEDGSLWTVDTLIEALRPMEGNVKIVYSFENMNAIIEGGIAWLTYKNKAVLTSKEGEENLEWAESAVFRKENDDWKMALLHSTRLKPKEEK